MNIKRISKKIISFILTAGMVIPSMPAAHAALSNTYVDPADVWIKTNGRTGELDSNAEKHTRYSTVTYARWIRRSCCTAYRNIRARAKRL